MDRRIERLHAEGCDTTLALERMADDEEFYLECLQEALDNPGFDGLGKALSAGEMATAFDCAHALKGVLGSVGLTPLFCKTVQIVEPLRSGDLRPADRSFLEQRFAELLEMRQEFLEILS